MENEKFNKIDMTEMVNEFENSSNFVEQYTRDFPQLANLVDGIPTEQGRGTPFVGDTTMAGLVRSIPRESLHQLPVLGVVINGTKNSIRALISKYLLKRIAFNEDTFGKGLLSTLQIGAEAAITYGYAPFMVTMDSMYDQFGTRMKLLHYSDTALEPGISDANESNFHYVSAHLTKSRLRRILRNAKDNPETSWNVPALQALLDLEPDSKDYSKFESAARSNSSANLMGETYQIVTRYGVGPGSDIITFSPQYKEAPLRIMENRSRWGYPRVQYLVIDPAQLNPFGISRVRLASPNQNMMNYYYRNIARMFLINSDPPIRKVGTWMGPVELKQRAVWNSVDPNAKAELVTIDNGSLGQFVEISQQMSAQIQNIMGTPTGTINSGSNAFGFSKTAPGVKMQQDIMDNSTNQITKILENFLRQYALVALDTFLSEQDGTDVLIVDDETKEAINHLEPDTIGDDNKIEINWNEFYESIEDWSVEVDVSLSPDELKDQKRADLQDMLVVLAQNAETLGPEAVYKVREITDMLLQDRTPLVKPMSESPMPPQEMPPLGDPQELTEPIQ